MESTTEMWFGVFLPYCTGKALHVDAAHINKVAHNTDVEPAGLHVSNPLSINQLPDFSELWLHYAISHYAIRELEFP